VVRAVLLCLQDQQVIAVLALGSDLPAGELQQLERKAQHSYQAGVSKCL
jgi:hypothetical protein